MRRAWERVAETRVPALHYCTMSRAPAHLHFNTVNDSDIGPCHTIVIGRVWLEKPPLGVTPRLFSFQKPPPGVTSPNSCSMLWQSRCGYICVIHHCCRRCHCRHCQQSPSRHCQRRRHFFLITPSILQLFGPFFLIVVATMYPNHTVFRSYAILVL